MGVGSDTGLLLRSLHAALGVVGQDRNILPTFVPEKAPLPITPLPRPPESLRPDRSETMNQPGKNPPVELAPGVSLDCLVGKHNGARKLTTGLVTFEPKAKLEYHTIRQRIHHCACGNGDRGGGRPRVFARRLGTIVIPRGLARGLERFGTARCGSRRAGFGCPVVN